MQSSECIRSLKETYAIANTSSNDLNNDLLLSFKALLESAYKTGDFVQTWRNRDLRSFTLSYCSSQLFGLGNHRFCKVWFAEVIWSYVNGCMCWKVCCALISPLSCLKIKGNPSSVIWWRQPALGSPQPLFVGNRNYSEHFALGTAPCLDLAKTRGETNEVPRKTIWTVLPQRTHRGQNKDIIRMELQR